MSYADSEDVKGDGFEFEATANPTPNLRLQLTYSVPKSVSTNNLVGSRAYFGSHLAEWQTVAANGLAPYAGTLAGDLVTAQQKLNETAVEATNAGLVKSTLSAFAVYSFNGGWANGLSIGGGATSLGEQNIRTGGALKSPGYTTWSALVAYQTKFGSYPIKIQLNVDNVFDNDTLVFTDFNTVGTETQGSAYYFVPPRKFTLSITMKL
jgi:outer membrane receptor for ferric coprogen and ferric-rhodotorulic acid